MLPLPTTPNSNMVMMYGTKPGSSVVMALFAFLALPAYAGTGVLTSEPLSPRTGPGAATLFESLSPDRTGIHFVHHWVSPETVRFSYGQAFMGCGVAIGDYDGDGRPDLYLSRAKGGDRLYRNLGGFRFIDVTEDAGVRDDVFWGMTGSFVDVNGDGHLDLYVCGYDAPNKLFINQGNGTFKDEAAAYGLDFKGASVTMAFADYDLDGDLDGYLLTNRLHGEQEDQTGDAAFGHMVVRDGRLEFEEDYREKAFRTYSKTRRGHYFDLAGQYDHLYRNNGDGTFTDVTREAGMSGPFYGLSATWWDFNADNLPDLYVANDYAGPDALYRNNGDGTFTDVIRSAIPHTPWFSMGSNVADLNNDGRFDYMGSDMSGSSHYKQKMGMGDMESASWFLSHPEPRQYMRNALYVNTGTGRFMEAAYLAGLADTDWTWAIKFADFDGDGWEDLFVSTGMSRDWTNSDLVRQSKNGNQWSLWGPQPPRREANFAFRNRGDLQFEDVAASWGLDHVGVSLGAAIGDLDGDGDLDIVVNNFEESPGVYRNGSTAGNLVKIRLVSTEGNSHGLGAVVRVETSRGKQSRYHTSSRGFASTDEPVIHFGLGKEQVIRRLAVTWPGGRKQVFEDLLANRIYTLTEPSKAEAEPDPPVTAPPLFTESDTLALMHHVENPYDDFRRQPLLPNKLSQLGPGLAWGDVDGDGDEDVFLGGAAGRPGMLYINDGAGRFQWGPLEPFAADAAQENMAPLFLDVDGDGDQDLYLVNGGYEFDPDDPLLRDRLYLNDGSGQFSLPPAPALPDLRQSGSCAVAADYDRDGDLDLFVGGRLIPGSYPVTPSSCLLQNEGGRFVDVTEDKAPGLAQSGLVTGATWSDADGDGWVDLWVTHEWGPVKFYQNDHGRLEDRTHEAGLATKTGWWNGITAGDIDNDGDIDYVASNFGLNTKYHATMDKPVRAYYGDMDGSGTPRFVETEYEGDNLYPVRGKSCSTSAMPMLGKRFKTFHLFAKATLPEIYTSQCISDARRFEATVLESGAWINQGDGRFVFEPLPRLAQIAPGFGIVLEDVDGDGNLDLYLAQNFFSPQVETGRMDGGVSLLLRNRGNGRFEPIWPDRSGLVVPGDAMGLTGADLNGDGWIDFAVAQNDGAVKTFLNRGHEAHRCLRVVLKGAIGNPTGVGARVRLVRADGPDQVREVYAGGSYLSQSSSILRFGIGVTEPSGSIDVRWPDGQTSHHSLDGVGLTVVIDQPVNPAMPHETRGVVAGKGRVFDPRDEAYAAGYDQMGSSLCLRGKYDQAIPHFRAALACNSEFARAHVGLAEALRRTGLAEKAAEHAQRAVNLDPSQAEAYFILGRIRQVEGDRQTAERYFNQALEHEPDLAAAHYHLAFLLEERGKFELSYDHFSHARRIDPDYGEETHFNFGRVHDARGRLEQAANHYRLALLIEPDNGNALNNLGSVSVRRGKIEDGVGYLDRAATILPDNAGIHQNLGTAFMALGKNEAAIASYRRTTELDPDNFIAHSRIGFLLFKQGKGEPAIAHLRQAVRLRPDALEALNAAAWILATHEEESLRNAVEAVRLAERACEISRYQSPMLLDTLAAACAAAGDYRRAVRIVGTAIKLDEDHQAGNANQYRKRQALYRQQKPYVN